MPNNKDNLNRRNGRKGKGGTFSEPLESLSLERYSVFTTVYKTYSVSNLSGEGFDTTALREHRGNLYVWWFPPEFCQSLYGENRDGGSNSCTLISLLLADKVSKEESRFLRYCNKLPNRAVELFCSAINEGNGVYKRCFGKCLTRSSKNLNIPDAMSSLRRQELMRFGLQEWFFTHMHANPKLTHYHKYVAQRLAYVIHVGLEFFSNYRRSLGKRASPTSRFLFAALIGDSRTMSFTFELSTNMVAVFDSHQHGKKAGAIIALCEFCDILELIKWLIDMQQEIYSSRPTIFEVSFLTTFAENPPMPINVMSTYDNI